jgi:hypothetical protein
MRQYSDVGAGLLAIVALLEKQRWAAHVLVATCIIGKAYHTEPMERTD